MNKSLAEHVLPKALLDELERVIGRNIQLRANPENGVVSAATRKERRLVVLLAFAQLWEMGYRLKSPSSFATRHVCVLAGRWDAEGLAAGTIHNRISHLSTFSVWIGKAGMIKGPADYVGKDRAARSFIAHEDNSWQAKGVLPEDVIERAKALDQRMALYLTLQHVFGLRVKESLEFRPLHSLSADGQSLEVFEGTKGGRRRSIRIETEPQRAAIAWAIELAKKSRSGRIRWPERTFKQAQRYFYYLLQELGVSRKVIGVSAHGLRHGFAHAEYRRQTGLPTPIEGGALGDIDREMHKRAGLQVSKVLGHSRLSITGAYYGSYGHDLRNASVTVTPMVFNLRPLVPIA